MNEDQNMPNIQEQRVPNQFEHAPEQPPRANRRIINRRATTEQNVHIIQQQHWESNRPERRPEQPPRANRRILNRRATTDHVSTNCRVRQSRIMHPISRLSYNICVVCKRLQMISTELPSSMLKDFICSIKCLNRRV